MEHDVAGGGTRNENSGPVGGDLYQVGTMYLQHRQLPPQVCPNGLPPPKLFVGRAAEAKELREWVEAAQEDGSVVVLVSGPGGIGSSAFAVEWGHRVRKELFPDGVLYVDLRPGRTVAGVAMSDVLGGFLQELGWQRDEIPTDLSARRERFRSWTSDRRVLVVVDHVKDESEVELLRPNSRECAMIITSQYQGQFAEDQKYRPLRPLDATEARTLLAKLLGEERVAAEETEAGDLVDLLGGVPAALYMAVAKMRKRPHMLLAKIVSDVRQDLAAANGRPGRPVIDVMAERSYRELSPDVDWAYRQLAWHPEMDLPRDVLVAFVSEAGWDGEAVVDELLDHHLLDEVRQGRFEVHPLVRAHSRRQAIEVDGLDAQEAGSNRWSDVYLRFVQAADHLVTPQRLREVDEPSVVDVPFTDGGSALAWLDEWRLNIGAVQRLAYDWGRFGQVYAFADSMYPFYMSFPYPMEMLESVQLGLAAAHEDANMVAVGRMGRLVGRALMDHGDLAGSAVQLAEATRVLDTPSTRRLWASAVEFEGRRLRRLRRFDDAIECHRQARLVFMADGDHRGVALQDHFIGQNLLDKAEFEAAVTHLEAALSRMADTGHGRDVAKIRTDLGAALHAIGDTEGARRILIAAANQLADENARRYEADALLRLAAVAEEESDVALARRALERVRDLYGVVDHPDLATVQDRLDQLADIDTDNR